MADGAKFEVGKIYGHRFMGDANARVYWRVASRSNSMMTIVDVSEGSTGETNRVKIRTQPGEGEWAFPMGQYSMAPVIVASRQGKFSRPGAPDTFAVEDRFYFGKGRKERFAEPREIEAKIRAWIDSRGLPIGSQETNALSYVAAQHMIRGGASIEQAVKSAARRHAQIGLASAGLRTWLEENA